MTVVITGTNDVPTITVVDVTGAVTEDAATPNLTDSGSVTFAEVDDTDLISSSVALSSTSTTGPAIPAGLTTALNTALTLTQTGTNDGSIAWDFSVANSLTQYLADGETVTATYTISVTDDSGTGTDTATQDVTIVITGTNDAPVLSDGTLASVAENTTNPPGESVGTIFTGLFSDVDTSGSQFGIAVVGNTANAVTEGVWQYSTDSGSNWYDIGIAGDDATALALSSSTLIRFVPVSDYFGTPTALVVRGLDDSFGGAFTSGATRENVDTTTNGTATAISAATADVNTSITGVNDAPVITGGPGTSSLTETDSGLADSGTLVVSDVDTTDNVTAAVDSVAVGGTGAGSLPPALDNLTLQGLLSVAPTAILDGTETTDTLAWTFNSGGEAFDFLAAGETLILTYTVSATDDSGTPLSDTETVTVTITGTNDDPTITVVDVAGAVTEDATIQT